MFSGWGRRGSKWLGVGRGEAVFSNVVRLSETGV